MKWFLLVLSLLFQPLLAQENKFNYSWQGVQEQVVFVEKLNNAIKLKRYAVIGSLSTLFGLYLYNVWYPQSIQNPVKVPIAPLPINSSSIVQEAITDIQSLPVLRSVMTVDQTAAEYAQRRAFYALQNLNPVKDTLSWWQWLKKIPSQFIVSTGSTIGLALFGYSIKELLNSLVYIETIDQFITQHTQLQDPAQRGVFLRINPQRQVSQQVLVNVMQDQYRQMAHYNSFEMLIVEFQTISLLEDAAEVKERIALLETKFALLMQDVMKVMGYLQYRQKQIAQNQTLVGVQIQTTLEIMDKAAVDFCNNCAVLLEECKEATELETRAQKTIQLQEKVENYANLFYADLHSIKNYARG